MTEPDRHMLRNVRLLFLCQALQNAAVVGQVAMGSLIGFALASDKTLATLPMAIQMLATMAASIPASMVFARLGRRAGFTLGAFGSMAGSLIFAAGIWQGDFWLYCLGAVPAGLGFGIGQHYRFAAAEVATPAYRPRAVSLVMAGGVLAAVAGPELVKQTRDLMPGFLFMGTYLILATLPAICLVLLSFAEIPPPPPRTGVSTPLSAFLRRPAFVTAAVTGAIAYGTMNLAMTSTPLEMLACGFGISASSTVIQAHAVAMFLPGFWTGRLILRFGALRIIVAGALLNTAFVAVAVSGETFTHFVLGLVCLGLGWNFMFTGATTLLAAAYAPAERFRAQMLNDLIVFGTVACTAFGSGFLHAQAGWVVLNLVLLPAMAAVVLMLVWRIRRAPALA
ncbi:putative MFS family arabinose efflux permease [Humitalea rosea]|uniref:Putative MFS family arabinose efflux permease n=1 Tax=Humitalea rosea TaxID=990373 RepID=A0A2W7JBH6_9PROT|nr:MFS transporter [Humitalea rosea]PZW49041.1 putative MFS family arabinose efflux permease [Humitalea rosea]